MKNPLQLFLAASLFAISMACASTGDEPAPKDDGWIQLFDGKDLEGWRVKIAGYPLDDNHFDTFRVEDGLLRVAYDQYDGFHGEFGHLIYDTPFDHYLLHVEYRFVGEQVPGGPGWAWRNSGVMLHGQSPESMGLDQSFPVSIEAQMLGGPGQEGEEDAGTRSTANLCTPGTNVEMDGELITRHCTDSTSRTYRGDQWVTMELEVHGGGRILHWMDGEIVLSYSAPQLDPNDADARKLLDAGAALPLTGGYLSLQSESHPVEFRKVELKLL